MYLFIILYLVSFLFCINMDDWFLLWLGLEMNMLSFIFLIYCKKDMSSVESSLKYFFIQSVGSAIFISMFYLNKMNFDLLGVLMLGYKMGGGPFFFWFPNVCLGISWSSCFLLMSFQKFIPLMLMMSFMSWVVWLIAMVSLMIGVMGSFNQSRIKVLMAFSSIHQIGWLFMCMFMGKMIGLLYYTIYTFILFMVIYKLKEYEIDNYLSMVNIELKWWFLLLMMNLGGFPPFLGFFLKWVGLYWILKFDMMMVLYMVSLSVVMMYIYMRVCYVILLGGEESMSYSEVWMKWNFNSLKTVYDFFIVFGFVVGGLLLIVFA